LIVQGENKTELRIPIKNCDGCMFNKDVGSQIHLDEGGNEGMTVCCGFCDTSLKFTKRDHADNSMTAGAIEMCFKTRHNCAQTKKKGMVNVARRRWPANQRLKES